MPLDRSRLAPREVEMLNKVMALGIAETDAESLASAILTKKGCSWMNNDPVDQKTLDNLRQFLTANNYPLLVTVSAVPTRNKYIWDVRVKK